MDKYNVDYLLSDACPCGAPRDDAVFCSACRTRFEQTPYLLSAAEIADIERLRLRIFNAAYCLEHQIVTLADFSHSVCSSCGDPSPTAICQACRESGELLVAA